MPLPPYLRSMNKSLMSIKYVQGPFIGPKSTDIMLNKTDVQVTTLQHLTSDLWAYLEKSQFVKDKTDVDTRQCINILKGSKLCRYEELEPMDGMLQGCTFWNHLLSFNCPPLPPSLPVLMRVHFLCLSFWTSSVLHNSLKMAVQ